jgi:hypothetical protein
MKAAKNIALGAGWLLSALFLPLVVAVILTPYFQEHQTLLVCITAFVIAVISGIWIAVFIRTHPAWAYQIRRIFAARQIKKIGKTRNVKKLKRALAASRDLALVDAALERLRLILAEDYSFAAIVNGVAKKVKNESKKQYLLCKNTQGEKQ